VIDIFSLSLPLTIVALLVLVDGRKAGSKR
jgi:hypothetical protein